MSVRFTETDEGVAIDELNGNPHHVEVDQPEPEEDEHHVQLMRPSRQEAVADVDQVATASDYHLKAT